MRTFDKLKQLFPDATLNTWHQHSNGNGWVENTAQVADSAYVGENAIVSEDARVFGNASVYGNAQVYGNAHVCGNAWVYGDALVKDGYWLVTPFYLHGTKHIVQICAPGIIKIGCEEHSIEHWLENYQVIGEKHGYREEEIEIYRGYIETINVLYNKQHESIIGNR